MAELEFVIVNIVTHRFPTDTCFCMIVDESSNVDHAIVLWQEKLVIGVAEGINI